MAKKKSKKKIVPRKTKAVKKRRKSVKKPLTNGKNKKGQFAKGNKAGKTSKTAEAVHKSNLTRAFHDAISVKDVLDITKRLVAMAKEGDIKATQQVLDRCLGKVKETTELVGSGGGPIQIVNYAGASK